MNIHDVLRYTIINIVIKQRIQAKWITLFLKINKVLLIIISIIYYPTLIIVKIYIIYIKISYNNILIIVFIIKIYKINAI
jgi:hypothetical protein